MLKRESVGPSSKLATKKTRKEKSSEIPYTGLFKIPDTDHERQQSINKMIEEFNKTKYSSEIKIGSFKFPRDLTLRISLIDEFNKALNAAIQIGTKLTLRNIDPGTAKAINIPKQATVVVLTNLSEPAINALNPKITHVVGLTLSRLEAAANLILPVALEALTLDTLAEAAINSLNFLDWNKTNLREIRLFNLSDTAILTLIDKIPHYVNIAIQLNINNSVKNVCENILSKFLISEKRQQIIIETMDDLNQSERALAVKFNDQFKRFSLTPDSNRTGKTKTQNPSLVSGVSTVSNQSFFYSKDQTFNETVTTCTNPQNQGNLSNISYGIYAPQIIPQSPLQQLTSVDLECELLQKAGRTTFEIENYAVEQFLSGRK